MLSALLIGLLLGTVARAAPAPGNADWTADEKAIAQTDTDFYAASAGKGGAAWGDFAAESARLPDLSSKAEIAAAFTKLYAQAGFKLIWHPDYAKVFGDVGVTSGPYERHVTGTNGQDESETGTYVTVWRRQPDGAWRFAWDGGTTAKQGR